MPKSTDSCIKIVINYFENVHWPRLWVHQLLAQQDFYSSCCCGVDETKSKVTSISLILVENHELCKAESFSLINIQHENHNA